MSFAKEGKNAGIILIDDFDDLIEAIMVVSDLGINPGGEVIGIAIDSNDVPIEEIKGWCTLPRLKLLQVKDFEDVGMVMASIDYND